jgi:hypothetical protein
VVLGVKGCGQDQESRGAHLLIVQERRVRRVKARDQATGG